MKQESNYFNKDIKSNDYTETFIIVSGLFFLWGFITSMNGILNSKLQVVFALDAINSILVQSAFFASYFIFSFIYYLYSVLFGDPILKHGFRDTIIVGLMIASIGCGLFYPAADLISYNIFLIALVFLAGGITLLQIAANSYVTLLGDAKNSASRLILAQALNALGATLAPFTSLIIFTNTRSIGSVDSIKLPYLGLTAAILFFAFLLSTAKFSNIFSANSITDDSNTTRIGKQNHVLYGFIAIFMYVGGEVSIGSFIKDYVELDIIGGVLNDESSNYVFYYWGSAMFGRFLGATLLAKMKKSQRQKLIFYLLFAVVCGSFIAGLDLVRILIILTFIVIQIIGYYFADYNPRKALGVFSGIVVLLLLVGSLGYGSIALWSIVAIGLFNSIMFPVIFTLGIKNLGLRTYQGASILIMGIVGGAIIPVLQELVMEKMGLQLSFLVPIVCYLYIVGYSLRLYKPKEIQP